MTNILFYFSSLIIIIFGLIIIFFFYEKTFTESFLANINNGKNCCVIRKRRYGSDFFYSYDKSTYCDEYHTNNLRTIKEGTDINGRPFQMNDCMENSDGGPIFGSCREIGRQHCVDFITEKDCLKYPFLKWGTQACNTKLPIEIDYYKYSVKNLPIYHIDDSF